MNLNRILPVMTFILAGVIVASAEPVDRAAKMNAKELAEQAKAAQSADDHRAISRQYELRAAAFEAKAIEHEREADRLARRNEQQYNPLTSKWPAMVQAPVEHQRGQAIQARRAARESRELMAYHQQQAAKLAMASE